jgi:hypothetical protein
MDEGRAAPWRRWIGLAALGLLALTAVRSAVVEAEADRRPELAHRIWPARPKPMINLALAQIGTAARQGQAPPADALALMARAGRADPLAPEPLLVAGTARLAAGDVAQAERLLNAALHRDPRSAAAHFLLADLTIRQGRLSEALQHVTALGPRYGNASSGFVDALATTVQTPAGLAQVGPALTASPALRKALLTRLAADPAALPTLASLTRPADRSADWLAAAVVTGLGAGKAQEVRTLLARAGAPVAQGKIDDFGASHIPLRWRFAGGSAGSAELGANGALHLVAFGREEGELASRPLLLSPGRYRLIAQLGGAPASDAFEWRLTCATGSGGTTRIPLEGGAAAIQADCPAQKLSLVALAGDFPRTVSIDVIALTLRPVVQH